jgi:hypothetical protein
MHNIYVTLLRLRSLSGLIILRDITYQGITYEDMKRYKFRKDCVEHMTAPSLTGESTMPSDHPNWDQDLLLPKTESNLDHENHTPSPQRTPRPSSIDAPLHASAKPVSHDMSTWETNDHTDQPMSSEVAATSTRQDNAPYWREDLLSYKKDKQDLMH